MECFVVWHNTALNLVKVDVDIVYEGKRILTYQGPAYQPVGEHFRVGDVFDKLELESLRKI